MKFKVKLIYIDGSEEILDEMFDTEEEAEEAALYAISCFRQGAEDLEMMGGNEGEICYDDPEYEIIEEQKVSKESYIPKNRATTNCWKAY